MSENEHVPEPLRLLQEYRTQLIRQDEYADAMVTRLNAELEKLAAISALPDLNYLGDVILTERYAEDADTCRAYLAVLNTEIGFGAICLDSDELRYIDMPGEFSAEVAKARMVRFSALPLRVRARLTPQVNLLINRLFVELGLRPPEPIQRETLGADGAPNFTL